MPNWVFNSLVVSGDKVELDKLVAQMNKPFDTFYHDRGGENAVQHYSNPVFAFWNIYSPNPSDFEEYFAVEAKSKSDIPLGDPMWWAGIMANQAVSKHWYDWNNHHWGTKWDVGVSDDSKYSNTRMERNDDNSVMYHFETAWSAVVDLIGVLSEMYPSLEFDYEYEEENGWGGKVEYANGEIISHSEYDEPNSHADYIERDQDCICNFEEEEFWFEDCPKITANTLDETVSV